MTTDFSAEWPGRLHALQVVLAQREIDVAILQYATDLYYYTGSVLPLYLLVPREGDARVLARKAVAQLEADVRLPVQAFSGSQELAAIFAAAGVTSAARVGFTLDTAAYATVQRLQRFFPQAEIADLSWDIRTLRMVKSPAEQVIMRRAGALLAEVPALARAHFHPGVTELELSAALEHAFRLRGHDALIRCRREGVEMSGCGVCATGVQTLAGSKFEGVCGGAGLAPAVPYGATSRPIAPGTPILLDFAFVLEGYHCDQTRMACWGEPPAALADAYAAMLQVQQTAFDALRPGAAWEDVYARAAAHAAALGYADTFMGVGRDQVTFVGHGVGLELDEPPFLAPRMPAPLAAGMVIAIEPKVAVPGLGVIGPEDTVLLHDDGPERLTTCSQALMLLE